MAIQYTASRSKKQYTRRIGDNGFLGADFSTAPIFASDRRFRDLKNVWKDYKSGSGVAIETIPGFRKVFSIDNAGGTEDNPAKVNGFYQISVEKGTTYRNHDISGNWFILHYGRKLVCAREQDDGRSDRYVVGNGEIGMRLTNHLINAPSIAIPVSDKLLIFCQPDYVVSFVPTAYVLKVTTGDDFYGDVDPLTDSDQVFALYKLNSTNNIGYMQSVSPLFETYVPTTYINGLPYEQKNMLSVRSKEKYTNVTTTSNGNPDDTVYYVSVRLHEKVPEGWYPYESNIVSVKLDGNTTSNFMVTREQGYVTNIRVDTSDENAGGTHTVDIEYESDAALFTSYRDFEDYKDKSTFNEGNPDYSGTAYDAIAGCTICASFDERIFLAGNPKLPNTIFYSQRDLTGYNNPTYFGVLNYNNLGTSNAPIKAMIPSASTLCVLKDDSATDPTLYFLTGFSTEQDLVPRIYTVESGLPGIGCKGAACNFLDDIVFMSRNGVIGIDKQVVNLERTLGDRSALINGKLLLEDVTQAVFAEAEGYLWCLFKNNGHVYLADSRAYTQGAGYEWYFIDSVGSWSGEADAYFYSDNYVFANGSLVDGKQVAEVEDKTYASGIAQTEDGDLTYYYKGTVYKVVARGTADEQASTTGKITVYLDYTRSSEYNGNHDWYNISWTPDTSGAYIELVPTGKTEGGVPTYYQIVPTGEKVGGTFHPATCMVAANDRIFLGTDNGDLLTFNNDKRGTPSSPEECASDLSVENRYPHMIRPEWYSFCGHRIESYVETEDDDGGIGNVTKDTVKRSCVVDLKALLGSRYKISVYSDRDNWNNENVATGSINDASNTDFSSVNFKGDDHVFVQFRERTRKWVHKRYKIESDGYCKPFGLYRITYNFELNGRVK